MSYLVFARKYRPQRFAEVVGQEHVARTLENALAAGRLAHAYLFSGPRGVGKTTMARLLAKAVNCLVRPGADPCNECEACRNIALGHDVDVLEIDAASNRKVEDVEPLMDATRYVPQRSARKVFIVDEVHMLSRHAFNAMLKTFEEPPPHVLFILATTEPEKVPETVRSRCQRFDFRRIAHADIVRTLRRISDAEGARVEEAVLEELARRATGGLRDAESLLDQALNAAPRDRALATTDLLAILGGIPADLRRGILLRARAGEAKEALESAATAVEAGADPGELLRDLFQDLRDAAVEETLAGGARKEGLGVEWCLAASEILVRHQRLSEESRAARAALDLALLAVARLGDVRDLEELVARLERLARAEGGAPEEAPRPAAPAPLPAARLPLPPPLPPPPPVAGPPAAAPPEPARGTAPVEGGGRPSPLDQFKAILSRGAPAGAPGPGRPAATPAAAPEAPLEGAPPAAENGPPGDRSVSGEELKRVRSHPIVREVLREFGGHIEQIRRNEDGEIVR